MVSSSSEVILLQTLSLPLTLEALNWSDPRRLGVSRPFESCGENTLATRVIVEGGKEAPAVYLLHPWLIRHGITAFPDLVVALQRRTHQIPKLTLVAAPFPLR